MMNTEPIDTLAQTFLFGLVFCSLLTDVYVFFQSSTHDKQMKKRIDYYSDVYKAVTSVGLNQYEVEKDGTIKIENENKLKETISSKVNEVKETLDKLEKEKKEIEVELNFQSIEPSIPPENINLDIHNEIKNIELKENMEDLTLIQEEKKKKKEKKEKERDKEEKIHHHSSSSKKDERKSKRK